MQSSYIYTNLAPVAGDLLIHKHTPVMPGVGANQSNIHAIPRRQPVIHPDEATGIADRCNLIDTLGTLACFEDRSYQKRQETCSPQDPRHMIGTAPRIKRLLFRAWREPRHRESRESGRKGDRSVSLRVGTNGACHETIRPITSLDPHKAGARPARATGQRMQRVRVA